MNFGKIIAEKLINVKKPDALSLSWHGKKSSPEKSFLRNYFFISSLIPNFNPQINFSKVICYVENFRKISS